MRQKSLKLLAITFFASGIWDTFAAMQYLFVIDPFYAIFLHIDNE